MAREIWIARKHLVYANHFLLCLCMFVDKDGKRASSGVKALPRVSVFYVLANNGVGGVVIHYRLPSSINTASSPDMAQFCNSRIDKVLRFLI